MNLSQMKEAYLQTINDFRIQLSNTEWWRFKRISYLQKQIEYYEGLLIDLGIDAFSAPAEKVKEFNEK